MRLNILAFDQLFTEKFDGNYHEAARQIGADSAQIHRIINQRQGAGLLFVERLLKWCAKHDVDYKELIFLPDALTDVNDRRPGA